VIILFFSTGKNKIKNQSLQGTANGITKHFKTVLLMATGHQQKCFKILLL
jgi:hypothetical protein